VGISQYAGIVARPHHRACPRGVRDNPFNLSGEAFSRLFLRHWLQPLDRRDNRQDCRQKGGLVGKDKRDCKQEGRTNN